MITRSDLELVQSLSDSLLQRDVVSCNGKFYAVAAGVSLFAGEVCYTLEVLPEGTEYIPKNKCTGDCFNGICNKKIAEGPPGGDIDMAYDLLLRYLNS